MEEGRHRRELSVLMCKEHCGSTGDSALHCAQYRKHNKTQHQIVATWMLGEEGKFLGNQTSLIWLFRKPFVLMPWAVVYYSWSIALGNYCIIWKKAEVIIILRKIIYPFSGLGTIFFSRSIILLSAVKQVNRQNIRNNAFSIMLFLTGE